MSQSEGHHCKCPHCQQETSHSDQELHRQMNLLLSRLDEQQRRWYVAVEVQNEESSSFTRQWLIWSIIKHDLHHGGEVSFTLGTHHLEAPDL